MKTNQRFITNLDEHKKRTIENLKYSNDRFDILVISISSGGLVFSMGFIKDVLTNTKTIDFSLLKISWIFFGAAIIFNLLSQVSGYIANKYELKITTNLIRQERGKEIYGNQERFEGIKAISDIITNILNGLSLLLLISAIVIFVVFISKTL
jgi:hypothetical protein